VVKERYSGFSERYFGSSEGTWIIFLLLFPFVHVSWGRKQYLPLMLQSRGPAASWLVPMANLCCQGGRVWWDAEMVLSYVAG